MLNELVRIHHAEYQEDLAFWISLTRGKDPVLELGCGHGRVVIPLLKEGRRVVGLDNDPESLVLVRDSLRESKRSGGDLVLADMLFLPFRAAFGAVIIPCNAYSAFSADERLRLLAGVRCLLPPGGTLAASLPNPALIQEIHSEILGQTEEQEPEPEAFFVHPQTGHPVQVSSRLSADPDSLVWEWLYDHLLPDGRVERYSRSAVHRLASLEVYQDEIRDAGFKDLRLQGDFAGSPYQKGSSYLVWSALAV